MASIVSRIKHFLHSPQGRQARVHAQRLARDPRNRARLHGLLARFRGGGHRPH